MGVHKSCTTQSSLSEWACIFGQKDPHFPPQTLLNCKNTADIWKKIFSFSRKNISRFFRMTKKIAQLISKQKTGHFSAQFKGYLHESFRFQLQEKCNQHQQENVKSNNQMNRTSQIFPLSWQRKFKSAIRWRNISASRNSCKWPLLDKLLHCKKRLGSLFQGELFHAKFLEAR